MKTRSYFGQPPGWDCLNFENFDEVQKWFDKRARLRSQGSLIGDGMVQVSVQPRTIRKRCVCGQTGMDGFKECYPPTLHRFRIALEPAGTNILGLDKELMSCDNHIQFYLQNGWKIMTRLCQYCCVAEVADEESDSCVACLDALTTPAKSEAKNEAQRLKETESGYCINRDTVLGCTYYAQAGLKYCVFCVNHNLLAPADQESDVGKRHKHVIPGIPDPPQAKIRTIPTSSRHCVLTPGCAGTMVASVRWVVGQTKGPELWWGCEVCKAEQQAVQTTARPSVEATKALLDEDYSEILGPEPAEATGLALAELPIPTGADMAEATAHIRTVIHETEGEG